MDHMILCARASNENSIQVSQLKVISQKKFHSCVAGKVAKKGICEHLKNQNGLMTSVLRTSAE